MIKKVTIMVLACMLFASSAHAKFVYCSEKHSTCMPIKDTHVYGVKGLLYESYKSLPANIAKQVAAKYARAIAWLEKTHKEDKKYKLENINSPDAKLIIAAIEMILNLIAEHGNLVEDNITRWADIGQQIVAEYSEKGGKVHWKLYMKKQGKKSEQ